jgi:hypothetical protein
MSPEMIEIQQIVDRTVSSSPELTGDLRGFSFLNALPESPFERRVDIAGILCTQTQKAKRWIVRAQTEWVNLQGSPLFVKSGAIELFQAGPNSPEDLRFKWGLKLSVEDFSSPSGLDPNMIYRQLLMEEERQQTRPGVWVPPPDHKLSELLRELRLIDRGDSPYKVTRIEHPQQLLALLLQPSSIAAQQLLRQTG